MGRPHLTRFTLKRLFSVARKHIPSSSAHESTSGEVEGCSPGSNPSHKPTLKYFLYEETHKATDGFHQDNLVGIGGHSEVYRGVLEDGQEVAVKRLPAGERREKEFLTELGTVGHVRHCNVCSLLGFGVDPRGLHLVFEFSSNGSVSSHLHDEDSPTMGWKVRHKIAVGTGRGIHYLHKGCRRRIIHRDIKGSNVLLTADFEPRISDFGLARWLPADWSHHAINPIEGTFGYLAPEYFRHGHVDEKTDVFAFGVFLLELISGRKPVDGSHRSLLSWAKPHLNDGATEMLVDPRLGGDYDIQQLNRLALAVSTCVRTEPTRRPSMTEVLNLMEDGDATSNSWKNTEEEEEEFWDFDDLEDMDDLGTPFSSMSSPSK